MYGKNINPTAYPLDLPNLSAIFIAIIIGIATFAPGTNNKIIIYIGISKNSNATTKL